MGKGNRTMFETYNILINAGVAGVFAIFAIVIIDRFMKFITARDNIWREFLRDESKSRDKLIADSTKATEKLDTTLDELCSVVKANGVKKEG